MTDTILGKRKILCADGHEDTCLLVRYLPIPFGYEVTTVNDMSNGLRTARTIDYDVDLISYKLAEGTGIEFCEKLRAFDRQTPILFWSARVYERDRQSALDAGANVLRKNPAITMQYLQSYSNLVDESQRPEVNRLSRTELLERHLAYAVSPSIHV